MTELPAVPSHPLAADCSMSSAQAEGTCWAWACEWDCGFEHQESNTVTEHESQCIRGPSVQRDTMRGWPAMHNWRCIQDVMSGSTAVKPTRAIQNDQCFYGDMGRQLKADPMDFDEFIRRCSTENLYLAQHSVKDQPELITQISPAPEAIGALLNVNLWYSPSVSVSSLHYDQPDNHLCVLWGSKSVHLYPAGAAIPAVGSLYGKRC